MIFNVMERDYWLLGSFTDIWECKDYIDRSDKAHWVGIFPDGTSPKVIPMWEVDDFIYNFLSESTTSEGKLAYIL